jgi:hypothetical protein
VVNGPVVPMEHKRLQLSLGRPLGSDAWTLKMGDKVGLQYALNPRGRPKARGSTE